MLPATLKIGVRIWLKGLNVVVRAQPGGVSMLGS